MVERFSVYDGSEKLDGVVIGNNFSYDPVSYATNHNMEYTSPPKGILWTGFDFGHRVAFDSFSYDFMLFASARSLHRPRIPLR